MIRECHTRSLVTASLFAGWYLLSATELAFAQSWPYGECRAGYWSSNRNLDDENDIAKTTCFVNWRESLSSFLRVGLGGRLGWADSGTADRVQGQLREGYLDADSGPWTVRLGRQIIAWGRADRINPTDSLSPRDFTLLVPEVEEERIGINAVLGTYQFNGGPSLSMVVVPRFEAHKIPEGSLPQRLIRASKPDSTEWAVKLDRTGEDFDWSVSYYDGFDRFARYFAQPLGSGTFVFRSTYERARILGADFATNAGSWAIRGEASASKVSPDCGACGLGDRDIYRLVLGVDRDFADTANINFQVFVSRRSDYHNPRSVAPDQRRLAEALDRLNFEFSKQDVGVTFRLSDNFLNDRWKLEFGAIMDLEGNSGLLRPRTTFAFSDSLKLRAGIDIFYGKEQSSLGSLKKNQVALCELALVF